MNFNQFWWQIFKPYRFYIGLMMLCGLLWGVYISVSPDLPKVVIDNLASAKPIQAVYPPAIVYVISYLLVTLNFRASDWLKYKILPPIKKDIAMRMFHYLKFIPTIFFKIILQAP